MSLRYPTPFLTENSMNYIETSKWEYQLFGRILAKTNNRWPTWRLRYFNGHRWSHFCGHFVTPASFLFSIRSAAVSGRVPALAPRRLRPCHGLPDAVTGFGCPRASRQARLARLRSGGVHPQHRVDDVRGLPEKLLLHRSDEVLRNPVHRFRDGTRNRREGAYDDVARSTT